MRLFLIWAAPYSQMKQLIGTLKENGHEIPYWVGLYEDGKAPDLKGTIFHDHYDAWVCEPARGVDPSEFPPPGKELIEKMYKVESLVLTMMNKKFDTLCVDERRHIYYNMLRYWNGLLEKYKPEAVIFPATPHTVYNYVIYGLAKILGIKTVMFDDTWVSNRILMYKDWMEGSRELKEEIKKNENKNFSLNDLSQDLKEYYEQYSGKKTDAEPAYMKHYRNTISGKKNYFFKKIKIASASLKDRTFFSKMSRFVFKQFTINLKKEYESVQRVPDFSQKFIYVALGFQPEMVTSPLGDMYADQILMIETLSASLPKGWVIYVKEHPGQWWLRVGTNYSSARYSGYYKRIRNINNVRVVPIDTNTFSLIRQSQAVAVVTGTPGWEALLRSKPALIFGYSWYRDCPGVFRINGFESCRKALEKISSGFIVGQQQIINYLKSFGDASILAYLESVPIREVEISKKESKENIAKAILSEITRS
ncbi:MAG: hypothetical protein Q8P07_06225 [bacterium]|nr:hypothetical protein [bacterium]